MTTESIFNFYLEPVDPSNRPLAFNFSISIFGKAAWPIADEPDVRLEIQVDDLFAYLVEFWRPLLLRQTYPVGLSSTRPSLVLRDAARYWDGQPQNVVDEELEIVTAFEEAHDLSKAFGGLFDLPHFWMLRQSDRMFCDSGRHLYQPPFEAVRDELARVGDEIAQHLIRCDADKWGRVVEAWLLRDEVDEVNLVAWSASVDTEVAAALIANGSLEAPKTLDEAANDNDPLLIAARMAGALPTEQITKIIGIAKTFKKHAARGLDDLSAHCLEALDNLPKTMQPHSQGEAMAREARAFLRKGPSERIDIFALAAKLGVEIRHEAVDPPTFDGLAIAGGHYGPGAFVNSNSKRIGSDSIDFKLNAGARVTLSHEFCHLLLDREHPLSAIEVLRSRMPASVEARAKAFAGEFLLPTTAATDVWDRAGSPVQPDQLEPVLQELAERYGVSFSVAAWKLEHGSGDSRKRLKPALDILAPYR